MSCKIDFVKDWELKYQGAESKLYYGLHSANRCVIKHRFTKRYRHQMLDKKLTKERTKRERRMIETVQAKSSLLAPYMPKVVWSNHDTIMMTEVINSLNLFDCIEKRKNVSNLAPLIGQTIAELHNIGIIHGDLTTSNLLLIMNPDEERRVIIPIDFGLSTGSFHPEERAVDLFVLERALISAHFADSQFFNSILEAYLKHLSGQTEGQKVVERLKEVRSRGRKSEYSEN